MSRHPNVTGPDDLTRIEGIGSKRAERLHAAGIRTYVDLASRSADDIAKLMSDEHGLSQARLHSWRDQARELAAAAPARAVPATRARPQRNGQHEESFMVSVLLNEDGSIRRTTARRMVTGEQRHWPRLERDALFDFIETTISAQTAEAKTSAERPPSQVQQAEAMPAAVPHPRDESQPAVAGGAAVEAHRARLASSAVLSVGRAPLRATEPFTMTMTIYLADPASHADRLAYSAVIEARPMAGGPKQTIARASGLFPTTSPTISIDAAGLPTGAYRLDGAVSLREAGGDHSAYLAAMTEGLPVQVLPG